eukprot:5685827-Pyramimonas_sp.AAC.1
MFAGSARQDRVVECKRYQHGPAVQDARTHPAHAGPRNSSVLLPKDALPWPPVFEFEGFSCIFSGQDNTNRDYACVGFIVVP